MDSDGADYEGARIADRGTGAGAGTGGCRKGGRLWLWRTVMADVCGCMRGWTV